MFSALTANAATFLAGIFALLILASLIVFVLKHRNPERDYAELAARVNSWWVMAGVFAAAMALSPTLSLLFLGFVSFLALKEYLSHRPARVVLGLSGHSPAVLLGGHWLVRHVHHLHSGLSVLADAHAHGAYW